MDTPLDTPVAAAPSPRPHGAPAFRAPTRADLVGSLQAGGRDFAAAPLAGLVFAAVFVAAGGAISLVTYLTGTTFWLVLAALGFPLIGAFAAIGFYEVSRRLAHGETVGLDTVVSAVLAERHGQLPWLAGLLIVLFLFWFFLGHMIFALFLGLAPMTNISSSADVFLSGEGLQMLGFGTLVGSVFAGLTFAISVLGMPMLIDRDVDFMTAMITSVSQVRRAPLLYLGWGAFIAVVTFVAILPAFLGLFLALPLLGHATWHLYARLKV